MTGRNISPWKKRGNGGELQKPFEDLRSMAESMDRAFENLWAPMGSGRVGSGVLRGFGGLSPEVEVKETAREVVVSAALPGVDKKDIHVNLTENRLAICAERKHETERKGKDGNVRREESYGSFCRTLTLPAAVKADKAEAEASYKDGVLRLELPKVKETQTRRIEIK
jgi:HSP20 family protein